MLVSQFEIIKMLEDESFNEFYIKISDLRNSMVNFGKKISDAKLIKMILKSLLERFRIKVAKIEKLVSSLQTYEFSLPQPKKNKSMALKTGRRETNDF